MHQQDFISCALTIDIEEEEEEEEKKQCSMATVTQNVFLSLFFLVL